jgi:hypothetical protein
MTYDFMTPSSVTTPYRGSQVGSITWTASSYGYGAFYQPITLQPNTTYNLQAVSIRWHLLNHPPPAPSFENVM